jgi:hypothetical protein
MLVYMRWLLLMVLAVAACRTPMPKEPIPPVTSPDRR